MTARPSAGGWLWRLVACGVAHAIGTVLGLAMVGALGLAMPRPIEGVDPTVQTWLLLPAGMAIAAGMAAMAVGLPGSRWQRAAVLSGFMFVVHGIGNALEASIFTTLGGAPGTTLTALLGSVLCAIAVSVLFAAPDTARPAEIAHAYFARWSAGVLAGRLVVALAAFPFIYFLFGMLISPIVVPHYERIDFLTIPPMPTLLGVLFTRSVLLLLASLPIIVLWRGSLRQLVVGLGLAHFVAVGLAGLIQGTFLPAILRWTHGVEVLADSMCYAGVLAWLFGRRVLANTGPALDARHGTEPAATGEGTIKNTKTLRLFALVARISALTLALVVIQGFASRFLPATQAAAGQPPQPSPGFFAIVLLVALLQTLALAYPVLRSRWHGCLLIGTVFVLYFGTTTVMSQMESMVYLGAHLPPGMLRGIVLMGFVTALLFSPVLVLGLGKARAQPDTPRETGRCLRMPWTTWTWKLTVGAAVFTALYYVFGYYVAWQNPALREYYGGTDPGSFLAQMAGIVRGTPWMLPLQFARGLLWVLLALPVMAMMKGRWWEAGLALSLLFAAPVVYLLFPNPVMPEAVRMTHLVETLPYQFLFGWFVAWLFARLAQQELPVPHHQVTGA